MASTAQAHARGLVLDDLPREVLDRILVFLPPRDLASLNATPRLFHAAPPGGCSAVERALRERARARGHDRALPATLPSGVRTWTEVLFAREAVLLFSRAHADVVAAGTDALHPFSAFVDAEGGLHTCGEEEVLDEDTWQPTGEYRVHVATGLSGVSPVRVPTRVASLSAVRVCAVAAGQDHLLALSEAGAVYGCGENYDGQLGLGHTEEQRAFALVGLPAREPVVCIAAGDAHSLALTAAGCAYSWGHNGFGQLGHGDVQDQHTPRRIEALAGVCAVHVSAGGAHSLVVDAAGGVYSCGRGCPGQLGHADHVTHHVPKRIEALAGVRAVRSCAGDLDSAVLGADGSAHTFGSNAHGVLGQGPAARADDRCGPARVALPAGARVLSVSLGGAHALFVTAPDGAAHACGERSAALGLGVERAPSGAAAGASTHAVNVPARVSGLAPLALLIPPTMT